MTERAKAAERLAELKRSFDEVFASPPPTHRQELVDLVAFRIGEAPFAMRVSELSGVEPDRTIVALPGGNEALLGVCGMRGRVVPVFCLASVLGHPAPTRRRWIALHGSEDPIGFALAELEGYLRVPMHDILPTGHAGDVLAPEMLRSGSSGRRLINLSAIVGSLSASSVPPPFKRNPQE